MEMVVVIATDACERKPAVLGARRDWSVAEKRMIVAETRLPGARVPTIAQRHGAAKSSVYQWCKHFAPTDLNKPRDNRAGPTPAFMPVAIAAPAPSAAAACEPASGGTIEIILTNGRRVRADTSTDPITLARLVVALEAVA